ncbi:C-C chemokine receptor type 3 [Acrasis kona]|uniref:C-C chemokine receptor type 3 n=1 Tax=Acrasis kona TaxID=1008807 RepID=A0AAW2ZQ17_9EUKA
MTGHYPETEPLLSEENNKGVIISEYDFNLNKFEDIEDVKDLYKLENHGVPPSNVLRMTEGCSTIMQNTLKPIRSTRIKLIISMVLLNVYIVTLMLLPLWLYLGQVKNWLYSIYIGYPIIVISYCLALALIFRLRYSIIKSRLNLTKSILMGEIERHNVTLSSHDARVIIIFDAENGFGSYSTGFFTGGEVPKIQINFSDGGAASRR